MPETTTTPVITPVTPQTQPDAWPDRWTSPDRICPQQRSTVTSPGVEP